MAVSARFGQSFTPGRSSVTVRYDNAKLLALTDRVTGWFRGGAFQQALTEANAKVATNMQWGMVDELERQVKLTGRKQRGDERLEMSLLSEHNREAFANTFSVGRESWLDRSPARLYWRRIEEGDAATFDSRILFTNDFGSFYGPWSPSGRDTRASAGNYHRKQPPGYKHMRMPQHRGAWVQNIGPYPAYRYSRGARRVLQRTNMHDLYATHLARVGINISDVLRAPKGK